MAILKGKPVHQPAFSYQLTLLVGALTACNDCLLLLRLEKSKDLIIVREAGSSAIITFIIRDC